jgi:mono/diheme cytochrome c family protein
MRVSFALAGIAALALAAACDSKPAETAAAPAATPAATPAAPSHEEMVARGKYLVESVGMCGDCHTPHLADGSLDATKTLAGSPLDFAPVHPMPFKNASPAIAGLPQGCTEETLALFLQNGSACDNTPPLPPMPGYRMNEADAKAVAAYLASLPKPG